MEEEKKTPEREEEQALPVQELPTDIPAEVRQKLAEDLNEQATEDLKQDVREAEKEEANDEEVKANPEMLTKSRLLKLLVKKQYVKLREVTEEEQPADLAELLEELDENNRLVVFRLLKKDVATEAFAYMSDEARDDLVNAFSDVELVSAIEDMSLDDAADLLEDMPAGVVKRVLEKSSRQTRESLNKLLNYPESSAGSLMTPYITTPPPTCIIKTDSAGANCNFPTQITVTIIITPAKILNCEHFHNVFTVIYPSDILT